MKVLKRLFAALLSVALLVTSVPFAFAEEQSEAAKPAIEYNVTDSTLMPGEWAEIKVKLKARSEDMGLAGFQLKFTYDSDVFEAIDDDSDEDNIITTITRPNGIISNWSGEINKDESGSITVAYGGSNTLNIGVDGSKLLFTIKLKVKTAPKAGNTSVSLVSTDYNQLTVSNEDGQKQTVTDFDVSASADIQIIIPSSIVISGPDTVAAPEISTVTTETVDYTATYYDVDGNVVTDQTIAWSVTGDGQKVKFENSNSGVLTVSCYVTAGNYTITAETTVGDIEVSARKTITITKEASRPASWSWTMPTQIGDTNGATVYADSKDTVFAYTSPTVDTTINVMPCLTDQYGGSMTEDTYTLEIPDNLQNMVELTGKRQLTIKAGAKFEEAQINIKFTNYPDNDALKNAYFKLKVTRAESVATTVEIEPETATIVIPTGETAKSQEFTAKVKDQYGELMSTDATFSWSVTGVSDESETTPTGVGLTTTTNSTKANLSVSSSADPGSVTVTASATIGEGDDAKTLTGSADVTLATLTFTDAPRPNEDKLIYGYSPDEIFGVKFAYGSRADASKITARLGETDVEGTYSIYATKTLGNFEGLSVTVNTNVHVWSAGTWYYKILFNSTDEAYKNVQVCTDSFTMEKMPITVSGITAKNKVYDGNANVELDITNAELSQAASVTDDTLKKAFQSDISATENKLELVSATGQTADKNAKNGKNVTITPSLPDYYKNCYEVSLSENITVNITPKKVTVNGITAMDREYNGSSEVTLDTSSAAVEEKIASDDVSVNAAGATGTMDDANAGENKTVTITGVTLTGADAGNYELPETPITCSVTISKKKVTVEKPENTSFTYTGSVLQSPYVITDDTPYQVTNGFTEYTGARDNLAVVLELKDTDNYEWDNSEAQDEYGKVTKYWSITKANARNDSVTITIPYTDTSTKYYSAEDLLKLLGAEYTTAKFANAALANAEIPTSSDILNLDATAGTRFDSENHLLYVQLANGLTNGNVVNTATITLTYTSQNYKESTLTVTVQVSSVTFKASDGADVSVSGPTDGTEVYGKKWSEIVSYNTTGWTATAGETTITGAYVFQVDGVETARDTIPDVKYTGTTLTGYSWQLVFNGTGDYASRYSNVVVASGTVTITQKNIEGATVTPNSEGTYTGYPFEPIVTVTLDGTTLDVEKDYTSTYTNCTDAGTGTVTVTGKGNYTGTATGSVIINPAQMLLATVTLSDVDGLVYDGTEHKPTDITVTHNSNTLTKGTDYTVSYSDDVTSAGTVTVTIKAVANGNYTGEKTTTYTINPYTLNDKNINDLIHVDDAEFTGSQQRPSVNIVDDHFTTEDYDVTYGANINAGTGSVTITGKRNYTGTATVTFTILTASAPGELTNVTKSYKYSLTGAQTAQISGVPDDAGTAHYELDGFTDSDYVEEVSVDPVSGLVSFTLKGQDKYDSKAEVRIPVKVTMQNYDGKTVDVVITFTDKDTPTVTVQNITKTYDGKTLTNSDIKGTASVEGNWSFVADVSGMVNAGTYKEVAVKFVPTDAVNYSEVEDTITVTINKATPTITVETETGEDGTPVVKADKDAETFGEVLTADHFGVPGTLTWSGKDSDGTDVDITGDTKLEDVDLDTVSWTFTPGDKNYESVTGGISQEKSSNAWWIIGGLGAIGGGSSASPLDDFTDLDKDAWYAEAVEYCLDEGLMSGTSDGKFSPNGSMTRSMVWTVLGRLSGQSFNGTGANWYADAQKWAIRTGVSDGTNPNGQVTREELVTMLWRFAGSPKVDTAVLKWYGDSATISDWAREAMAWAVSCSLVEGSNWSLNPGAVATRCQVAAIFMRYHKG